MASETAQVQRSDCAYHVLLAISLSSLYLCTIFSVMSFEILRPLLSLLGVVFFVPLIGVSLIGLVFTAAYGLFAVVLVLSFYLQQRTFARTQLLAALILAIVAGGIPVAFCLQLRQCPVTIIFFVLLQIYLAIASTLESNRQLNPRT